MSPVGLGVNAESKERHITGDVNQVILTARQRVAASVVRQPKLGVLVGSLIEKPLVRFAVNTNLIPAPDGGHLDIYLMGIGVAAVMGIPVVAPGIALGKVDRPISRRPVTQAGRQVKLAITQAIGRDVRVVLPEYRPLPFRQPPVSLCRPVPAEHTPASQ